MERRSFFGLLLAVLGGVWGVRPSRQGLTWVGPTQDLGPVVDVGTTYTAGSSTTITFDLQASPDGITWTDMDTPCIATQRFIQAVSYT